MNKKDFEIYKEGYMLGVKETLAMFFEFPRETSLKNKLKKQFCSCNIENLSDEKPLCSFCYELERIFKEEETNE